MSDITNHGAIRGMRVPGASKKRYIVLFLLCLLYLISYLDRVNISVTAPTMMKVFHFNKTDMGLIFSAFAWPYALLQIIGGALGDRFGPRKVLSILMSWWSIFTMLTGIAWSFSSLFVFRLLFGFGEAGGFPVATRAMASWFPPEARGFLQGITHAASRFGGAIAPPIVVAIMVWKGWQMPFYMLGAVGILWSIIFLWYYRDNPAQHPGVNPEELQEIFWPAGMAPKSLTVQKNTIPWHKIVRSKDIWALVFSDFCYGYSLWVYLTWLPTYLVNGRHFAIVKMGFYAMLPLLGGMLGDIVGGVLSDYLWKKTGSLKIARRLTVCGAMLMSLVFTLFGAFTPNGIAAVIYLTIAFFFLECANANLWATSMDLGGTEFSGTVSGIMNTGFGVAGMVSPVIFGAIVDATNSWILPFMVSNCLLLIGALTILIVNPESTVVYSSMSRIEGV
ncbi:MFS transporter [Moorella sp. Hama-1]|uniref:MFS transporter n=1 Tax=Moorella sp. Hama-1 TaxID=2138101 RepID=UPI000D65D2EE|nr:MFS transporter [Moorella sp. Hama-1]BCV22854.1 MFS transporter [Moorella sp. Hama-1]